MPTYEYRCPEGHEFEIFQRMSDEPGATCPECGGEAERLLSAGAGLLFKGEGFYITDYRSESYRKAAKADSEGAGDSAKAGDSGKSGDSEKTGDSGKAKDSGAGSAGGADSSSAKGDGTSKSSPSKD